jgi:hypothetical protein
VCLLSGTGEHLDQLAISPDADSLRRLARRIDEVHAEPVCAVVELMTGARRVHDTLERLLVLRRAQALGCLLGARWGGALSACRRARGLLGRLFTPPRSPSPFPLRLGAPPVDERADGAKTRTGRGSTGAAPQVYGDRRRAVGVSGSRGSTPGGASVAGRGSERRVAGVWYGCCAEFHVLVSRREGRQNGNQGRQPVR